MIRIAFYISAVLCFASDLVFAQTGDLCTNPYVVNLQDPLVAPCGFAEVSGLDFTNFNDDPFTPSPSCSYGANNNDIWIKLTIPTNADGFKITMDSSVITSADNDYQNFKVAVYTGSSCGSLTYKTCKSSSRARVYNNFFDGLVPGEQVYVRIYTDNSPSGTWDRPFFSRFTAISTTQTNDACPKASALLPGNYCNYLATDKGENDDKAPDKLTNQTAVCDPGNADFGSFDNNQWYYFEVTATTTQPVQITISNVNCSVGDKILQAALWKANSLNCATWGNGYNLSSPSSASEGDLLACAVGTGSITLSKNLPIGKYWYTVDGSAGSFCEYAITTAPVVTVPIHLINFYSEEISDEIKLFWSCSNVEVGSYFVMEYSEDGLVFSSIDTVLVSSPLSGIQYFQHDIEQGGYYRIKIVGGNYAEFYSNIIEVKSATEKLISAHYCAGALILNYSGRQPLIMYLKLYAVTGVEVLNTCSELKGGENELRIHSLERGIYFVQLFADEYSVTQKIIVSD